MKDELWMRCSHWRSRSTRLRGKGPVRHAYGSIVNCFNFRSFQVIVYRKEGKTRKDMGSVGWQSERKGRPVFWGRGTGEAPAMFDDDIMGNGKAKPGAMFLGGEKRGENIF